MRVVRACRRREFGTVCDGLAAVGVGAVGRVEALSAIGHRGELTAGSVKLVDVAVEVTEMPFEQIDDVVARAEAVVAHVQDGSNLGEGESGGLGVADEAQPVDCILSIVAVAVGGALGLGEDPDVLVVADGLGGDVDASGEFSDLHGFDSTT